jgi:phosphatidylglycerophosphatase A
MAYVPPPDAASSATTASANKHLPRRGWPARLFLLAGSIGPLGHLPASGTVAVAVAGVPLCWLMRRYLADGWYLAVTAVFAVAAIGVHHLGDRLLGEADSRKLVWDELVGFFIAMYAVPWSWPVVAVAFLLERAIDIVKIPPARWVDRHMHSGLGVVLDDVIAGLYTCALLHLGLRLFAS